jgi:hypothetical protein
MNAVNMAVETGMLLKMGCECLRKFCHRLGRMPEYWLISALDVEAISMESSVPDCANPRASGSTKEPIILR